MLNQKIHVEKNDPNFGEFVIDHQDEFKYATGELSRLLSAIRLATKIVNNQVNIAGLTDIIGDVGDENIQGERQQKLDVFANEIFSIPYRNAKWFVA